MNKEQYNRCVASYSDALFGFIFRSLHDRESANDIVQESYIALWENVMKVDERKAKSFLYTTAYRRMVDLYRKNARQVDVGGCELDFMSDSRADEGVQQDDRRVFLERSLALLPHVQRDVILLKDYQGYSYKEVAEVMTISETQVKVYLFRARHKLRELLGDKLKYYGE